jgi:hypothetical protein
MFLHNGSYVKGFMEWDLDNSSWRFSQRRHNGTELLGIDLPDFCQNFQKYIIALSQDGTVVRTSALQVKLDTSQLLPYNILTLQGQSPKLSITVTQTVTFGWTLTRKSMRDYVQMIPLTSLVKMNTSNYLYHPCVHLP